MLNISYFRVWLLFMLAFFTLQETSLFSGLDYSDKEMFNKLFFFDDSGNSQGSNGEVVGPVNNVSRKSPFIESLCKVLGAISDKTQEHFVEKINGNKSIFTLLNNKKSSSNQFEQIIEDLKGQDLIFINSFQNTPWQEHFKGTGLKSFCTFLESFLNDMTTFLCFFDINKVLKKDLCEPINYMYAKHELFKIIIDYELFKTTLNNGVFKTTEDLNELIYNENYRQTVTNIACGHLPNLFEGLFILKKVCELSIDSNEPACLVWGQEYLFWKNNHVSDSLLFSNELFRDGFWKIKSAADEAKSKAAIGLDQFFSKLSVIDKNDRISSISSCFNVSSRASSEKLQRNLCFLNKLIEQYHDHQHNNKKKSVVNKSWNSPFLKVLQKLIGFSAALVYSDFAEIEKRVAPNLNPNNFALVADAEKLNHVIKTGLDHTKTVFKYLSLNRFINENGQIVDIGDEPGNLRNDFSVNSIVETYNANHKAYLTHEDAVAMPTVAVVVSVVTIIALAKIVHKFRHGFVSAFKSFKSRLNNEKKLPKAQEKVQQPEKKPEEVINEDVGLVEDGLELPSESIDSSLSQATEVVENNSLEVTSPSPS